MAFWHRGRKKSKEMADFTQDRNDEELDGVEDIPRREGDSDRLIRLQADFENYKRRNQTARAEAAAEARRGMLSDLLAVYDNFLRAREHAAEAPPEAAPYLEGFDAIRVQLEQLLATQGLEEIPASAGEPFDPRIHEAVATIPTETPEDHGLIAELVRKGYTFKGNVLRPAVVTVYD